MRRVEQRPRVRLSGFAVFLNRFGQTIVGLMRRRITCDVTLRIRSGQLKSVRIVEINSDQTLDPEKLATFDAKPPNRVI